VKLLGKLIGAVFAAPQSRTFMAIQLRKERTLKAGYLTRIHVNRQMIAKFHKDGIVRPSFTVKHRGTTYVCSGFQLKAASIRGVQSLLKPLACGARVWLETRSAVTLLP
jgi:hypothetical protein